MYLQDENGGYYIYSMANDVDPAVAGVQVGMTVQVAGLKTIYSGTHEVKEATVEIINEEISELVIYDYTEIFKNASSLTDPALAGKQAQLVTIQGVTVLAQDDDATSNNYYKFQMGDLITYVRVSGSVCPIPKAEQAGFIAAHGAHTGWIADVTGVISVYDGRFYLTPVDANAFDYTGIPERSDAEKVAYEQENLTLIGNITENGEITLLVNGVTYESVLISWASDNACAVVEGGKLIVTLPEEATNVTITATLTCGGTTLTKEFTVLVDAAATAQYQPNFLTSAPVAGEYVFAMDQSAVEGYGILYATGEIGSKGQLLTTDKAHKAAKFVVAVVDGGYTIQFEGQYLEGYLNGTYKNLRYSDNACVWTWNDEAKVFTCNIDGTDYYFGTYMDSNSGKPKYDYMSLSAVSYITGSNASKIDVSQYVGHLCEVKSVPANGGEEHEHVAGAEWLKDAENHWNVCSCGEIMNKAAHDFSNGNCVCGQEAPTHTHAPEADYSYDADFHWNECACGEQVNKAAHDFSNGDCVCGKEAPAVEDKIDTVAEALAASEGDAVVITGTITGIYQAYSSQYNNISVYITDETGTILAFRLVGEWSLKQIITVTGTVTNYNGTMQIAAGCTAVLVGTHECNYSDVDVTEPNCNDGGFTTHTCPICNDKFVDSEVPALGHTTDNGTCDRCGNVIGSAAPSIETVTYNLVGKQSGWGTSYTTRTINLDGGAKVVFSRANEQQSGNTIDDRPVIGANSTTTPNTVTFTAAEGKTIDSITFNIKRWTASKYFKSVTLEYYDATSNTWVKCATLTLATNGSLANAEEALTASGLPAGVTQVRLSVLIKSGSSNTQIGITSIIADVK